METKSKVDIDLIKFNDNIGNQIKTSISCINTCRRLLINVPKGRKCFNQPDWCDDKYKSSIRLIKANQTKINKALEPLGISIDFHLDEFLEEVNKVNDNKNWFDYG
jgi:hypothetical protein